MELFPDVMTQVFKAPDWESEFTTISTSTVKADGYHTIWQPRRNTCPSDLTWYHVCFHLWNVHDSCPSHSGCVERGKSRGWYKVALLGVCHIIHITLNAFLGFFPPVFSTLNKRTSNTVEQLPHDAQGAPCRECLKDKTSPRTPVHCSLHAKWCQNCNSTRGRGCDEARF